MPIIEASFENARTSVIVPGNKWYHLVINEKPIVQATAGNPNTGSRAGNPMVVLAPDIADGDFEGTRLFGWRLMAGGINRNGDDMRVDRLAELIDALAVDGVSWTCLSCKQAGPYRMWRGAPQTKDSGKIGCANCGEQQRFRCESDDWVGHKFNGLIIIRKRFNSDEDQNEISRVRPYGDITEA